MSKIFATAIAGLFTVGAYAQTNPAEIDPTGKGKAVDRAEARKSAQPASQVKATGGDQATVAEGSGGVTASKALDAGEARKQTRDARRPAKSGGKKPVPIQGGTPQ
ncbi:MULTISPECIES: cell envelope biogenesis protein TolA [unclassified Variovorax]|uniref:cell envelope biogenesis protein TolA n=1 Tax=unclassified Variovorax TaxID=663243 RepID=UPI0032E59EEC